MALRGICAVAVTAFIGILLPAAAVARPGDLDKSFGGGFVDADPHYGAQPLVSLILQSNGDPVSADGGGLALFRHTPAGVRDSSFGSGGVAFADPVSVDERPAVAFDGSGGFVVAGAYADDSYRHYTIVERLRPDGSIDSSFGSGGRVLTPTGGYGGNAIVVQSDGKVVVGASGDNGTEFIRYLADGSLDGSFGSGGQAVVGSGGRVRAMALDADGRIVAAVGDAGSPVMLVRLLADGAVDHSFGNDGFAQFPSYGQNPGIGESIALAPDGSIVAGGHSADSDADGIFEVARFTPSGQLDPSFANGGVFWLPAIYTTPTRYRPGDAALAVALQSDGKIVAVGDDVGTDVPSQWMLVRLTPSGELDPTFGDNGHVLSTLPPPLFGEASAVAVQQDGNLMVAGWASGDGNNHLILARYEGGPATSGATGGGAQAGQSTSSQLASGVVRHRHCVVPRLIGKRRRTVKRILKRAHCRLGHVKRRRSHRVGRVIAQHPRPHRRLRVGARVSITIGVR